MVLKPKQEKVLQSLLETCPEISTLGHIKRANIVDFIQKTGSSWPSFITNQKPIARGVYPIPGHQTIIINEQPIEEVSNQPQMKIEATTVTATERKAAKRRAVIEKTQAASGMVKGSAFEPNINPLSYKLDLIKALNYYNSTYDNKDKVKWVLNYVTDRKQKVALNRVSDHEFHSIGALVRLKSRGELLEDRELSFIDNEINRLVSMGNMIKEESSTPSNTSISKRVNKNQDEAICIAGEFEGLIDSFIVSGEIPDFASYLKSAEVSSNVASLIPEMFKDNLAEIEEAINGGDPELIDGYSKYGKVKLRKLLKVYQSIGEACQQQKAVAKIARKPRKKKEQPVSKIIAKLNYQKENEELGLKSELPSKLVGATEVWLYNTKNKKLHAYKVSEPSKMSVKGTTLIGWDPVISNMKSIRKPDKIKNLVAMGKRELNRAYKDLSTKEQTVNGRLNEHTIILKVFS